MDITFGVLPLAVVVLQGCHKARKFVTNYKSYDDDVRQILRTVGVQEYTLKQNLHIFLQDIIEQDILRAMLTDLSSPYWHESELNTRLSNTLGDDINPINSAILSCSHTLQKIQDSQVLSFERLAQEGNPEQVAVGHLEEYLRSSVG
ncbi:hypothetical protein P167DRAFT_61524 [Morchella conica CCBAS932]|uniref:Uncharacterized protein n=1 Tax=Morchella conica CCBAS932 TaxID=1392247 RepID=A0A3N4K810_9PEZI|nr:hypothetical protein P167DRAFT_61524 [Morchella conica CCBAS932]